MNNIEKLFNKIEDNLTDVICNPLELSREEKVIISNSLQIYSTVSDTLDKIYEESARYM